MTCEPATPLLSLVELQTRGHPIVSGVQTPSQCPDIGRPYRDASLQPLENKALSWGIIRKSACILAEITIRKSQKQFLCQVHGEGDAPSGWRVALLASTMSAFSPRWHRFYLAMR